MGNENSAVQLNSEKEKPTVKTRRWGKKLLRILSVVSISFVALYFGARLVWRFSGSNHWELIQEKNGVKVYSLKAPGSDLQKFKGTIRLHSTLSSLVKMFQDPDICLESGCASSIVVERVDDQQQFYDFRYKLPFPFRARQFVAREQFYQNPHTKAVLVEVVAAPDKTPPDDCCFRVTDMNNTWLFTPLDNGEIDVEWVLNMNEGGFIPDLMLNKLRPKVMFAVLPKLQVWVTREKYRDAKFDFIKEKGSDPVPHVSRADVAP